jgi:diaminohydroxyphosphoribosylaminopyrimidine deaminase/5-amino-6-(5-phosphoribosylamino)uracil reductase
VLFRSLTVRDVPAERQPVRVVVDSRLRIGLDARILEGGGVIVATATNDPAKARALEAAGAEVWVLPDATGKVDLAALARQLGRSGMNEVLVEAGINLHSALLAADIVDELVVYLAPHLLGDAGRGMIRLPGIERMDERLDLEVRDLRAFGPDLRLIARVVKR